MRWMICGFVIVILFSLLAPSYPTQAAVPSPLAGREASLNSTGAAYEINLDAQGQLWITDYGSTLDQGEIWQVNPATSSYTVYMTIPNPSDARRDPNGNLWWVDAINGRIGELPAGTADGLLWDLPVGAKPYGTAVDEYGRLWVSDSLNPALYRFEPGTNNLCAYSLPDQASLAYLAATANALWFGDAANARLYRLDLNSAGNFNQWALPTNSNPQSLVAGATGAAWADPGANAIIQFDPGSKQLTTYTAPAGTTPYYLTAAESRLWFTQTFPARFGQLDPEFAGKTSQTLTQVDLSIQPNCHELGQGTALAIQTTTGTLTWTASTYTPVVNGNDWAIFTIAGVNASAGGISYTQNRIWMIDTGQHKLISIPLTQYIYLPALLRP